MPLLVTDKWPKLAGRSGQIGLRVFYLIAAIATFLGGIALLRDTAYQGQDFEVCWKTAHHLLSGEPVYDLIRDGAMSFKYPPWIVPVFLPLGFLPLVAAKWIWGGIELLSLGYVIKWLLVRGYTPWVVAVTTLSFWGIWAVHFMDAQITLPMLALGLWSFEAQSFLIATWTLSAKVFSLFSMFGFSKLKKQLDVKKCAIVGGVLLVLSAPAVFVAPGHSIQSMVRSWSQSASSGGLLFDGEKVRGRDNQGMPALILRAIGIKAENTKADLFFSVLCALVLGAYWRMRSQQLSEDDRLIGWFALTAVIHPLAWFHFFVLAFPLAVVCLDGVIKTRDRRMVITGIIALAMVCLMTRRTLGYAGERLEFYSIKTWGVLLFLDLIVMLRRSEKFKFSGLKLVPAN